MQASNDQAREALRLARVASFKQSVTELSTLHVMLQRARAATNEIDFNEKVIELCELHFLNGCLFGASSFASVITQGRVK